MPKPLVIMIWYTNKGSRVLLLLFCILSLMVLITNTDSTLYDATGSLQPPNVIRLLIVKDCRHSSDRAHEDRILSYGNRSLRRSP